MSQFNFPKVTAGEQPQNNLEIMIDIESLGTTPGSPIVTIGAVLFDPYKCDSGVELMRRSLLLRIDVSDVVKLSRGVEGGTLRWWFEQKDEAIKALVGNDCLPTKEALHKLWRYCHERGTFVNEEFRIPELSQLPKTCRYWAKDPDFDMALLRYFYEHPDIRLPQPWRYAECRSVRTVQDLAWPEGYVERPDFEVPGVAHDARYDAITQALTVQAAMHRLGLSKDQDVKFDTWKGVQ